MKFLAAAIQMVASDDKAANLMEAARWVRQAASRGARVVALPEVFIWRGSKKLERENAEPVPGPASNAMAVLAAELKIYLLAGSILEAIPGSEKSYNTSLLFDPAGKLLASYRKIHLFDVALANGASFRESATRAHGEAVAVGRSELCTMGLSVCYDLRFPELYRGLAKQGAQIIFVPSAFTAFTGA
ncbi:MAG: nitrilase-related carbon-nitrogen hydrolase, partial [Candidatus Binatia bacterium]